jgi:mono/diheme cytochrome c family protein
MAGRRVYLLAFLFAAWPSASPAVADDAESYFARHVRPILARHCQACHGPQTQESDLRLDRAGDLLSGGVSGPAVVPGHPERSLLISAVRQASPELQMPPDGRLSDAEIATVVRWVEMGTPHAGGDTTSATEQDQEAPSKRDAGRGHWAFQAPVSPPLPPVRNGAWVENFIDRFVLARLEQEGLSPARPADRRTLIRRATFDLTGLPPTLAQIEAFLADRSPQAFANVVDRLLASPSYGQRWGRHWLDVARYADSNGLDENVAHGNAWRYRDWVIRSLNADLPYDEFLRCQLAGDLLPTADPAVRNQRLIATGFLSLGPKVLAEVDKQKMEMDIIDEQLDTLGRALVALTLGCARCHDHKFDPIAQKDYYALAGIFKSTHTMDSFQTIARWHEHELHDAAYQRAQARHAERLESARQRLETLTAAAAAPTPGPTDEGPAPEDAKAALPPAKREEIQELKDEIAELERDMPQPPTAMGVREGEPVHLAVHLRGSHLTLGDLAPRGIPDLFPGAQPGPLDPHGSGRLELASWLVSGHHPLTARVMVNRVWRWHFGRGLVETADNFGLLGGLPSHPGLLDHLATEFTRDWSLKKLHRRIMLSATYQAGSRCSRESAARDPDNRLLSRAPVRRLEAEAIRDAMLAVSGALDCAQGGPVLATENRQHIFDHTSRDNTSYKRQRRSVYLPVVRNHLHDAFTLFDYTDASVPQGDRSTSTVASQALYLMNSDFVADVAQRLATRLLRARLSGDAGRIQRLYLLAYGRPATTAEVGRGQAFLRSVGQLSPGQGWPLLCHSVLISSEFLYVR